MKRLCFLAVAVTLSGCVTMSPQQMSSQSSWNVCRFTMGGPHSEVAEQEMRRRSLDCRPYYPAIEAKLQAENAAVMNFLQATQPKPRSTALCTTHSMGGGTYSTICN